MSGSEFNINRPDYRKRIILSLLFFGFLYALIALVNHLCFRTYALDLGVYTSALYDYAHFRFNDSSAMNAIPRNILSDHFDLFLMLISPLGYVFGAYTLQIVQIAFVLFGGLGVYKFLSISGHSQSRSLSGLWLFCTFYGVYSALSFDYHSNVPAACILPWLMYRIQRKEIVPTFIMALLMLMCKESVPVFLFGASAGMALLYRKDKLQLILTLSVALISVVWFILSVGVWMPAFTPGEKYVNFKYHALGENYYDAFRFVLLHPLDFLHVMMSNYSGDPQFDQVKAETYIFLLFSGGLFVLLRPQYLVMLIIPLVMKMCYDDVSVWSVDTHYSIEFAPVLAIGTISGIERFKSRTAGNILVALALLFNIVFTFRLMDYTHIYRNYARIRFYQMQHYTRSYNTALVGKAIRSIPPDAPVSAQSPFHPHVAYRDKSYQLPIVSDAEYIIVSPSEEVTYPLSKEIMLQQIADSVKTGRWYYREYNRHVILVAKKH